MILGGETKVLCRQKVNRVKNWTIVSYFGFSLGILNAIGAEGDALAIDFEFFLPSTDTGAEAVGALTVTDGCVEEGAAASFCPL